MSRRPASEGPGGPSGPRGRTGIPDPNGPIGATGGPGDARVPLRSCAGCRARRPKGELIRFARGPAGPVFDASGRAGGRGAYTCPDPECLDRALRRGGLSRTLRMPIPAAEAAALRLEAVEYLVGGHGKTTRS